MRPNLVHDMTGPQSPGRLSLRQVPIVQMFRHVNQGCAGADKNVRLPLQK